MSDRNTNPGGGGGTARAPVPREDPPSSGESLLIAGALQQARRGSDTPDPAERLPPPNTFPGYELIREIHRGGQGVVYLAVQKATKRKVAVKVLHQGPFAGEKDRQRFEREVEILAQLNHPNIVAVIDSGSTAPLVTLADGSQTPSADGGARPAGVQRQATGYQGSFFCVMEYISGAPLDAWVREKQPGIDRVLDVFAQICDAVNAAHLKGIIHRDLKPANIRVDHDGKPHVLDFGLARVGIGSTTGGETPELMTMTGQFIGSLPWASPEQAEGAPEKLDVRTDVYSLGVMLYQMLTDKFPYPVIGMMRDVLDNILRAEPARPSTVRRQINNEVETIVLKCLSKERERRYQTAGELGRDLARYLAGEPIEAKRDSALYLITKTARRHKAAASVAAGFVLLTVAFGAAMAGMYRRAEGARIEAVAATGAAETASAERQAALEASRAELAKSDAVREFLEEMLIAVDPARARGRGVTVAETLTAAADKVDRRFEGQPDVQAAVKQVIGQTYLGLGMGAEAEAFLRSAFDTHTRLHGAEGRETLDSMALLAEAVARQPGRFDTARELYTALIPAAQRAWPNGAQAYRAMYAYGVLLQSVGRREDSIRQFRLAAQGLERVGAPPEDRGRALVKLAEMVRGSGTPEQVAEAAPIMEQGVALLDGLLGAEHPHTGTMRVQLGCVRGLQGRVQEAEALFRDGLGTLERVLDGAHPDRLDAELVWADFLHRQGRLGEAEAALRSVVERTSAAYGAESLRTAWARAMLGSTLNRAGRWAEAEAELMFALGVYRDQAHDDHFRTRAIAAKIAQMFRESGQAARVGELPAGLR